MREITCKNLSLEAFKFYGTYQNFLEPDGFSLGDSSYAFYPDRIVFNTASLSPLAFSPLVVEKREMLVDALEFHKEAGEFILPINGDVVIHVGHPSPELQPDYDAIEAFYIPKGTVVCLKPGVWHLAAFPVEEERVHVMVALPERTYVNDLVFHEIPKDKQAKIIIDKA